MKMTEQELVQGLAGLIEEIAQIPAIQVTPDASLREDLGIDSLSMVEIVVAAVDAYGIEISDDDLRKLATVQDVVDFVQRSDEPGLTDRAGAADPAVPGDHR